MAVATGPGTTSVLTKTFKADADLSAKQFYWVKMTANPLEVGVCSAKEDRPIGVLQNKPDASGKEAEVMMIGISKVSSDAALNEGDAIGPSADGQSVAKTQTTGGDTTEYVGGTVIAASGAAGEMAEAAISTPVPHFVQV